MLPDGLSIAASRNSVSATGNAVTTANRSAPDMGGTSVKASTPVAATTTATCERIIRREAGADQNDCCQCSEGIFETWLFSCPAYGSNNASPAAIRTPGQPSTMSGWRLDLDQRSGHFGNHSFSECRAQRTIQAQRLPAIVLAIVCAKSLYLSSSRETAIMAEINKLSVEKALDKLRAGDAKQSKDALFNNKIDALDEEIERMRTQRLRLERHQRKRDKGNR